MKNDQIPGGLAAGRPDSMFPLARLSDGAAVEREHTDNPAVAREIAKDHLVEDPKYYEKLKRMEKSAFATAAVQQRKVAWIPQAISALSTAASVVGGIAGAAGPKQPKPLKPVAPPL